MHISVVKVCALLKFCECFFLAFTEISVWNDIKKMSRKPLDINHMKKFISGHDELDAPHDLSNRIQVCLMICLSPFFFFFFDIKKTLIEQFYVKRVSTEKFIDICR